MVKQTHYIFFLFIIFLFCSCQNKNKVNFICTNATIFPYDRYDGLPAFHFNVLIENNSRFSTSVFCRAAFDFESNTENEGFWVYFQNQLNDEDSVQLFAYLHSNDSTYIVNPSEKINIHLTTKENALYYGLNKSNDFQDSKNTMISLLKKSRLKYRTKTESIPFERSSKFVYRITSHEGSTIYSIN